jgi:perosamine synthetase
MDVKAVVEVLKSDFLTTGPMIDRFEDALCKATGAKYAITCSNGTTALHLACLALGVSKGDLGVTSPLTFLASANCIEYCGGRTDFVDIDPERLCLSPEALEAYCCKEKPKVVIPVDFAGIPADLPGIYGLSRKYGFKVIEDAAHSLGSFYTHHGVRYACGSCAHADLATLSFHPVKNITTGEGGAVLTNSSKLADRVRLLRSHGMVRRPSKAPWYYEMSEIGYNYRITDIQCGLGLSQLKSLKKFKQRREALALIYDKAFNDADSLVIPPRPEGADICHHLYPVQFTAGERMRLKVYQALLSNGIRAQVHYYPVHLQPYYMKKYGYRPGKCESAESFYARCLSMPLFPGLKTKILNEICRLVIAISGV